MKGTETDDGVDHGRLGPSSSPCQVCLPEIFIGGCSELFSIQRNLHFGVGGFEEAILAFNFYLSF